MLDPTTGKHVYLIDASLLKESSCLRKIDYIHNHGLTTLLSNFKMDYGTAFHKFAALYVSGADVQLAMQAGANFYLQKCLSVPEEDFRTIDHLMMTMQAYHKGPFNRDIDMLKPKYVGDKPCIEFQFSFPYLSTPSYDVMLTGTIDMQGIYIGREVINDYKCTSVWNKEDYLNAYDLDQQLAFYSWMLKQYGLSQTFLPGMITGIFLKKPTQTTNVNGKRVAVNGWNGASFARSPLIEFSDRRMLEFERWLKRKINAILEAHDMNEWSPDFNICSGKFGPCMFCALCKEENDEMRELKLKSMYLKREYNPAMFQQ